MRHREIQHLCIWLFGRLRVLCADILSPEKLFTASGTVLISEYLAFSPPWFFFAGGGGHEKEGKAIKKKPEVITSFVFQFLIMLLAVQKKFFFFLSTH